MSTAATVPAGRSARDERTLIWAAVGLVAVIAGALRAVAMPGGPLWYDEAFSLRVIDPHGTGSLWTRLQNTESTPPVYYWLSSLARQLGVEGVASIRVVSVAAAALVVVVAFWAAGRFFAPRVALGAAVLLALSPMVSSYAINGRSYSLLLLLSCAFTGVFGQALRQPTVRVLAAWAALAIVACWTHYFAAFLVLPAAAMLLAQRPEARRRIAVAVGVWILASLPLLTLATKQGNDARAAFIGARSLTTRTVQAARELLGGYPNISNAVEGLSLALAVGGIVVALLVAARRYRVSTKGGGAPRLPPEWILAILAGAAFGVPLLISILSEHYDRMFARNVIVALPALMMLVAAGLVRRRPPALAAFAVLCALMAVGSYAVLFDWRYGQEDVQGALEKAGPEIRSFPILTNEPRQAVLPLLLQRTRAPLNQPVTATRLDVFLSPKRIGSRKLGPVPIPRQIGLLTAAGFMTASDTLYHGVRHIVLFAAKPIAIPPGINPPMGLFLPAPLTDPEAQRALLGDNWG